MATHRLLGILILAVCAAPLLMLPVTIASPGTVFQSQVWLIPVSELTFAATALALSRQERDRLARFPLAGAAAVYGSLAILGAMKAIGLATTAAAGVGPWLARVAAVLFAVGLWRMLDVPRWIPALFALAAALSIAGAFIPQTVIEAVALEQLGDPGTTVNWWMAPTAAAGLMTYVGWVALGIGMIRRNESTQIAAV